MLVSRAMQTRRPCLPEVIGQAPCRARSPQVLRPGVVAAPMTHPTRLLTALLATLAIGAASAPGASAIVGGSNAPAGTYDAVANVNIAQLFGCTGTLIAPQWVLSAGHCGSITGGTGVGTPVGWPAVTVTATVGTTDASGKGGEKLTVDRVVLSPSYLATDGNDISLLHVSKASIETPVKIAGTGSNALWAAGVKETIAGFGVTSEGGSAPDVMQVAQVPIVADADCAKVYSGFEDKTQICPGYPQGGVDTCQGRSGGPLFGHDSVGALKVVGATSYGNGCARPNTPGVYARVSDT